MEGNLFNYYQKIGNMQSFVPTRKCRRPWVKVMVIIFVMSLSPQISSATVLGDLANQMAPGTWAELPTLGMNQGHFFETVLAGKAVTQWSHKAAWDPNTEQFFFVGSPHYNPGKFVIYSAITNTWREGPLPESCMAEDPQTSSTACISHGYDHSTMDPASGSYYYRQYNFGKIFKYNVVGNTWENLPIPPQGGFQVAGMVQYFPEMGGLLFADARFSPASLFFYNPSTNQWSTLSTTLDLGPHSHVSGYSSTHKVVIFGGGSNDKRSLYKVDANGSIVQLNNAPFNIRVGSTVFTPDPSGNFLVLQSDASNNGFYEYDVANDTWTLLDSQPLLTSFGPGAFDVIGAPISNYGVVMYLKYYFDQTKVFLYKHKQGSGTPLIPDTAPPTVPSVVQGNATSPSEIYLQWQPSTDDRLVAGYTIFRNGVEINSTGGNSFFDSTIPGPGFYQFSVLAFDAAGNKSPLSSQATIEVQGGSTTGSDFLARCSNLNVVRCFSFDSQSETDPHVWAPNFTNGVKLGTIDTVVKSSGAGSLKFDIPSNSPANTSGLFWLNFMDDNSVKFGEGEDFYIQWRQRFSPEFIDTLYYMDPASAQNIAGGWKQVIIGEGDSPGKITSSCTSMELVVQNSSQQGFPQMYHSCGHKDGQYQGLEIPLQPIGSDWALQSGDVTGCNWTLKWSNTEQPWNKRFVPPYGPCVGYKPNEWMTFQVHVHIGTWYRNDQNYHQDSTVELWVGSEGQPSVKVMEKTQYDLVNCPPGDTACYADANVKYGKIWLLPYHTSKGVEQNHLPGVTWYDDLIISRAKIADPQVSSDQFPPAPPKNLQVTQ